MDEDKKMRYWFSLKYASTKLPEIVFGQIITYCEQIQRGSKLVAEIGFAEKDTHLIQETINNEGCKAIFDLNRGYGRATVWIYKYDYVALLIDQLFMKNRNRQGKLSALEIWTTGKLFGYSNYEISNYLKEHGYIQKPSM